jgi:hypothetical protein
MVHPGTSASNAGDKLSVGTTAEELDRRKATVYIDPIFAPCCLNIEPGVRTNLLEFPFVATRSIVSMLCSRTLSRGPDVDAVEQIRFGRDAENRIDRPFAGRSRWVAEEPAEFAGNAARVSLMDPLVFRA